MRFASLLTVLALTFVAAPAASQIVRQYAASGSSSRLLADRGQVQSRAEVAFGPFVVLEPTRARLRGITDSRSPQAFDAMLRRFPGIAVLEMSYCLGTVDDQANLRLGRMIRARGITTFVPRKGFVGSGAVELFLAGARRFASPSASFGVHSWRDESGREPADYHPNSRQNGTYIDYYRAMGMSERDARQFYAMTNSVPFSRARYLSAEQMKGWINLELR
jgi:hypothetical protein